MIVIQIDLTKISKDKIKNHDNGSKYYSLVVDELQQPDRFGNTHTVYENQSKEERAERVKKTYIGNGKEYKFNKAQIPASAPTTEAKKDDLPF